MRAYRLSLCKISIGHDNYTIVFASKQTNKQHSFVEIELIYSLAHICEIQGVSKRKFFLLYSVVREFFLFFKSSDFFLSVNSCRLLFPCNLSVKIAILFFWQYGKFTDFSQAVNGKCLFTNVMMPSISWTDSRMTSKWNK